MTPQPDSWFDLRRHTGARIALGRAGNSLPTAEWLQLGVAHALARDAVHAALDGAALAENLAAIGCDALVVESAAPDRATYLRRPDLGRQLSPRSAAALAGRREAAGDALCVVIADGLSAGAVQAHALPLLKELLPRLHAQGQRVGAVLPALQGRVALGDEAGELLGAPAVLVLIGERPGLSSTDSLGAYLTWGPRVGRSDAQRNCVSNIRPAGLSFEEAAHRIAWLLGAARRLGATGVVLKDDSGAALLGASPAFPMIE